MSELTGRIEEMENDPNYLRELQGSILLRQDRLEVTASDERSVILVGYDPPRSPSGCACVCHKSGDGLGGGRCCLHAPIYGTLCPTCKGVGVVTP